MSTLSFVALSLQTTHLDPASVSKAAYVKLVGGNITRQTTLQVVTPTSNTTPDNDLAHEQLTWDEVLEKLRMMIGKLPIVSYYRDADKEIFNAASRQFGIEPPVFQWLDCRELARTQLPELPDTQLSTVLKTLGLYDDYADDTAVEQTAQIVLALAERNNASTVKQLWGDLYHQPDDPLGLDITFEGLATTDGTADDTQEVTVTTSAAAVLPLTDTPTDPENKAPAVAEPVPDREVPLDASPVPQSAGDPSPAVGEPAVSAQPEHVPVLPQEPHDDTVGASTPTGLPAADPDAATREQTSPDTRTLEDKAGADASAAPVQDITAEQDDLDDVQEEFPAAEHAPAATPHPTQPVAARIVGFSGIFFFGLLTLLGIVLTIMATMVFFTPNTLLLETKIAGVILMLAITLLSALLTVTCYRSFRRHYQLAAGIQWNQGREP